MRKLLLSTIFVCFAIGLTFGQIDTNTAVNRSFKHSLGIGAGFTTGIGLSYRYSMNNFKVQTTFAPIKDSYSTEIHVGLSALLKLVDTDYADFFLYQGNYFLYEKDNDLYSQDYYSYSGKYIERKTWNHGLGIGIEFLILKRVGFNIMGGYAAYDGFERIGLTGETGLYFMF